LQCVFIIATCIESELIVLIQKSMRYLEVWVLHYRTCVRHVTFSQAARAMLNLPCLQHALQVA
jgi:hypothetical protein